MQAFHNNFAFYFFFFQISQGTNKERNFNEWSMKQFQSEIEARGFLQKYGLEHYWDIALSQSLQEESEDLTA